MRSPRRVLAGLVTIVTLALGLGAARDARAQNICANFFPLVTGTYADRLGVTVSGVTTTATAHGVTGLSLGGATGTTCTTYVLDQFVARFDFQLVGVDPGEEVWFDINSVEYPLDGSNLTTNPNTTAQPLFATGGRLRSAGADGSAIAEITAFNMTQVRMCGSGGNGMIVRPTVQSFCQCANGHSHYNEDCDDGNLTGGDGCSAVCEIEIGWSCTDNPAVMGTPSTCVFGCGNGMVGAGEACDDGDTMGGDGCAANCTEEGGWTCTGTMPSACTPFCGDGARRGGEPCDDGNMSAGDGCSSTCTVESGWACNGEGPGSCTSVADGDGDGVADVSDNCPAVANPGQGDGDGDGDGDACDNCPAVANANQANGDGDPLGNACDNCPAATNPGQENTGGGVAGDACDDRDTDSVIDTLDNCVATANGNQVNPLCQRS